MVTSTNGIPVRCAAIDPKGKMVAVTSEYVYMLFIQEFIAEGARLQ